MKTFHAGVWPSLDPRRYLAPKAREVPFPLGDPSCTLFSLGRHALWNGVRSIDGLAGKSVLVPSLHHGSEVEALIQAGMRCVYYPLTPGLEPDLGALDDLVDGDVAALHLIHYLGFPQDVKRWRKWCDQRGIALIEDAAQAFMAESAGVPVGSMGDLAIFCLYKSFGLPDGAALVSSHGSVSVRSTGGLGFRKAALRHGAWLGQFSRSVSGLQRAVRRKRMLTGDTQDDEKEFALGDPSTPPSTITSFLLHRTLDERATGRRRDNYRSLLAGLAHLVPRPFEQLPEGASPFAFPITAPRVDEWVTRLREKDVNCIRFWTFPHPTFPVDQYPVADSFRGSTVILPVHQELRPETIDRIVAEVLKLAG